MLRRLHRASRDNRPKMCDKKKTRRNSARTRSQRGAAGEGSTLLGGPERAHAHGWVHGGPALRQAFATCNHARYMEDATSLAAGCP
jgi:hypothetical protein